MNILKPIPKTVRVPATLLRCIEARIKEEHYGSFNDYNVGLLAFDIYARRRHWLTARIMQEPIYIREIIFEELVSDFERGEMKQGGWFDARIEQLIAERRGSAGL